MTISIRSGFLSILAALAMFACAPPLPAADANGQILGGSLQSPIRIEVFSDFQCSACREFYLGTIRQILQEYSSKDKVCIIYHEFPLRGHRYSRLAAQYSEAAALLGVQRQLAVMDALYMDQATWSQNGKLEESIAKALPREDLLKMKKVMQSPSIDAKIERDLQLGLQQNIKSTPTMIITTPGKQQRVEGYVTYPVLKQFINSNLK